LKTSLKWIRELLPKLKANDDEIARRLTDAGLEVESTHRQAAAFDGVVAVEIKRVEPHPSADKLRLVTVWDGAIEHRIVCGAPDVAVHQKVPLAKLGAKLPNGMLIAPKEIRGVPSEGMLCSAAELGLSSDHGGLLPLAAGTKAGRPLAKVLGKDDVVLDIAAPANRPDLLSHVGIAREIAALFGLALPVVAPKLKTARAPAAKHATVRIDDDARCPRYLARIIEGVTVGPSPEWLVQRLDAIGVRSISNVVDATNLALMELGHPLHAFDLARLGESQIIVRRASAGEAMTTLDGVARTLDADDLVIADAARPVALAGVIGGSDSEVGPATKRILLECALFEPRGVRRSGKRHGLHTEASHRFERGADAQMMGTAVDRCAQLIVELAGGEVLQGTIAAGKVKMRPTIASIRPARATALLGRPVDKAEIKKTLGSLGLVKVKPSTRARLDGEHFAVPSWRLDLVREVDLIDEIARIAGFDTIPAVLPGAGGAVRAAPPARDPEDEVRQAMVAEGYSEAISLAFTSPSMLDAIGLPRAGLVELANPLGEESGVLRPSLLPALLRAARHNQTVSRTDLRLFEIGRTFKWRGMAGETLPEEVSRVAVLLRGKRGAAGWWGGQDAADVFDLKGAVEALLEAMGVEGAAFVPIEVSWLHPRASGEIVAGDLRLGVFGELHPDVARRLELDGPPVFVAELSVDLLAGARGAIREMKALPRFPGVGRDLSFFVERNVSAAALLASVRAAGGPHLHDVALFDVYEGKGVPEGQRSIAVTISFRAPDRTLKDEEVDRSFGEIMSALTATHSAHIRKA